ncbi:MAG: class I SAM-dependent methyltransferase [Myxococcota bacterium]|nr:class I SAM-dependent methyltransferase [Myxococcota bacterium]
MKTEGFLGAIAARLHHYRARRLGLRGDVEAALRCTRQAMEAEPLGTDPFGVMARLDPTLPDWQQALTLPGCDDLPASLREEARRYFALESEEAQEALDAPLPDGWNADAYDEQQVQDLFARDPAFLFANLRVAGTDPHVPARLAAAQVFLAQGARHVLDYGAGVGNMGLYFAAAGIERVSLADLSKPILDLASWRFGERGLALPGCHVLSGEALPEGRFDGIAIFDVFEVVPDPASILEECHRALSEGGTLIIAIGLPPPLSGRSWLIGQPAEVALGEACARFGAPFEVGRIRRRALWMFRKP